MLPDFSRSCKGGRRSKFPMPFRCSLSPLTSFTLVFF